MITTANIKALREAIRAFRQQGERVAFVPTMGNLHEGHLTLVRQARARAERVVVSIFVNPMQFNNAGDLAAYPRTEQADCRALEQEGVDLVFLPTPEIIYPRGMENQTFVEVPGLSSALEGASRPGHFRGVATVVTKLFNLVQPDVACFGQKDFQQLALIRQMTEDLALPIEIVGVPTVREADGLAMSSRNGRLSDAQRALAPALYQQLCGVRQAIEAGERDFAVLAEGALAALEQIGFKRDRLDICNARTLAPAAEGDTELVLLGAAYLGEVRLIDNIEFRLPAG